MSHSDEDRRRAFDTEALPQLDTVYRVALRLTGDPAAAEDLAQDTFLKAFRSWQQYRPGTNIRAWLLTILRHAFINDYRRARQRGPSVDVTELEPFTVFRDVQDADPEGSFFDQIVDDEVYRAIDALPEEFREAVVLSDIEGLSYADIADMTGAPVGTVKSRIYRGRQLLQKDLYEYAVEMGYVKRAAR